MWLAGRTPEPDDGKVAKTALGTDRYLTFHRVEDGPAAAAAAKAAGYQVVGIELADGAVPLHELSLGDGDLRRRRPRGPRVPTRHPGRLRRRRLPSPPRPGGLAQRRHRRLDRLLRGAPPGLDADLDAQRVDLDAEPAGGRRTAASASQRVCVVAGPDEPAAR